MSPGVPPAGRARWVRGVVVVAALLVAGGMCALRYQGMRSARDERVAATEVAIGRAVQDHGTTRSARFTEAREAAADAARIASTLFDPYPPFLLQAIDDLEVLGEQSSPDAAAPPLERGRWLLARGQLAEASSVFEAQYETLAPDDPSAERLAMYRRLVQALQAR